MESETLLAEFKNNSKMAREHAYLSQYEDSIKNYSQAVVVATKMVMFNSADEVLKSEWTKCIQQINKEMTVVQQLLCLMQGNVYIYIYIYL